MENLITLPKTKIINLGSKLLHILNFPGVNTLLSKLRENCINENRFLTDIKLTKKTIKCLVEIFSKFFQVLFIKIL